MTAVSVPQPISAREQIRSKPPAVQTVIQVWMTREAINDPNPDWAAYARKAIVWWEELMKDVDVGEINFAEMLIAELRQQPGWGKILRGSSS